MEFDKIKKDIDGFYFLKSLERYFIDKTQNIYYTRYSYCQKKPFIDLKTMIQKLGGEIFKLDSARLKRINPILVYFVSCASLNKDIPQDIDFYINMFKDGINLQDDDIELLKNIIEYSREKNFYDFEALFAYICILIARKEQYETDFISLDKLFQNFNKNKDVQNRIYNTIRTKDNYLYILERIGELAKGA